jgi:hypothetical protein
MRQIPLWMKRKRGGCAISIETQAFCNHFCEPCPRNLDPTRSRWHPDGSPIMDKMPTSMVEDLIGQAADMGWRGPIHFAFYSEPLYDKRFVRFVKYAKRKGLIPELHTNGSYLTDELIKEIDGWLGYVTISFNSPGSQEFWRSKFKRTKIRVDRRYQVLIWNKNTKLLNAAIERARGTPCTGPPMIAFRIQYDGQMAFCYADMNNEFGLLNAYNHSLEELWFGKEHVKALKEMAQPGSREKRELCSICPQVYPDEGTYVEVERSAVPPENWWKQRG